MKEYQIDAMSTEDFFSLSLDDLTRVVRVLVSARVLHYSVPRHARGAEWPLEDKAYSVMSAVHAATINTHTNSNT